MEGGEVEGQACFHVVLSDHARHWVPSVQYLAPLAQKGPLVLLILPLDPLGIPFLPHLP